MSELSVSVIIPVGPAETSLVPMLKQLHALNQAREIIFVFCPDSEPLIHELDSVRQPNIHSLVTGQGRALQMNQAARVSQGDYIWFLHLDSRFSDSQWRVLQQNLLRWPLRLHYFNLSFNADGKGQMWFNSLGANLRSRWLGLPFGDQGFCISQDNFQKLNGYPDHAPYGEDHLFIWRAHQWGIKLNNVGAELTTSARKYAHAGWGRLTLRYQGYWIKQAIPELWQLLKIKLSRQ